MKPLKQQVSKFSHSYCYIIKRLLTIGNAVAALTDVEKRKQYDLYGNEEPARNRTQTYNRGFETEVNPEELFNMFFGTGFGSNVYVRRGGRWQRHASDREQEHRHGHRAEVLKQQQKTYSAIKIIVVTESKRRNVSIRSTTTYYHCDPSVYGFKLFYI